MPRCGKTHGVMTRMGRDAGNFAVERGAIGNRRREFQTLECVLCESLVTDSLVFDRFRSADAASRALFTK
jgi:hypothetical protein